MAQFRLKELRDLTVVVVHPPDDQGKALVDQLSRIGCRTELIWPPAKTIPPSTDVVFAGIFFDTHDQLKAMLKKTKNPAPAILAIVNYENPAMLQKVLEVDALAVVSKPIRAFGMLTNLVVARSKWHQFHELTDKVSRLEKKIATEKKISSAKQIIMQIQSVNEKEAYRILRSRAMTKRVSIEEMANIFINANDLLSKGADHV